MRASGARGSEPLIHIIPVDDEREHTHETVCWCEPSIDWEDRLVVHNAADMRELYEQTTGETLNGKKWGVFDDRVSDGL